MRNNYTQRQKDSISLLRQVVEKSSNSQIKAPCSGERFELIKSEVDADYRFAIYKSTSRKDKYLFVIPGTKLTNFKHYKANLSHAVYCPKNSIYSETIKNKFSEFFSKNVESNISIIGHSLGGYVSLKLTIFFLLNPIKGININDTTIFNGHTFSKIELKDVIKMLKDSEIIKNKNLEKLIHHYRTDDDLISMMNPRIGKVGGAPVPWTVKTLYRKKSIFPSIAEVSNNPISLTQGKKYYISAKNNKNKSMKTMLNVLRMSHTIKTLDKLINSTT